MIARTVRLTPLLSTLAAVKPRLQWASHPAPTTLPAHPICKVKLGYQKYQKVKLLIPRNIPGSFCETRFSCLTRPLAPAPTVPLAAVVSPATALVFEQGC